MNGDRKRDVRGKAMLGTALFGLGIVGAVVSVVTGYGWVGVPTPVPKRYGVFGGLSLRGQLLPDPR